MSDRFDFLELDNSRPPRLAPAGAVADRPHTPPPEPRAAPSPWKIVEIIGGPGSAAGEFACPGGLAVDAAGNLFVADAYNHRVQRITPAGDVHIIGRRGSGPGEFMNPQAVVTDKSLGFAVLEQGGCRIQKFGPNVEWQGAFGFRGRGRGEMLAPTAMAGGPCGALFVADTGNNRIIKWSPDDVFADSFPHPGDAPLMRPLGIAVDGAGRIWVAETARHRLIILDPLLRPLGALGREGSQPGEFREPQALAILPDGTLMVADTGNNRIQVLDRRGHPLQEITGGRAGSRAGAGLLNAPGALTVRSDHGSPRPALADAPADRSGARFEVYLSDTGNNRILRLAQEKS